MNILHTIPGLSRGSGGPARSSQGLVAALYRAGVDVWLWTANGSEPWIPGVRRYQCLDVRNVLSVQDIRKFDLVHVHCIWDLRMHRVCALCRKAGVPYVIAPRGMLEPWSLKQKWLKKRIARFLYQDRDLRLAAALHATAESEAEQFRRLGFKNKIIVSPNGVNVPEKEMFECSNVRNVRMLAEKDPDCLTRKERECIVSRIEGRDGDEVFYNLAHRLQFNPGDGSAIKEFISRLIVKETPDGNRTWTVEFSNKKELTGMPTTGEAATVEVTHLKSPSTHTILKLIYAVNGMGGEEGRGARSRLTFLGCSELFSIERAADLIRPSQLNPHPQPSPSSQPSTSTLSRCGWWVDNDPETLAKTLREAMSLSDEERRQMGEVGHEWIRRDFSWEGIGAKMKAAYEWLLDPERVAKPEWVRV